MPDQLLTIAAALELVLEKVVALGPEEVALEQAAGRILAADARARVDLPSFPASAMDGFALRAADAPAALPVVGRIAAGKPATRALEPGQAMSIATGGVVPDGADTVVPIEDVEEQDGVVRVPEVREGQTCAYAVATSARASSSSGPVSRSARSSSGRSPPRD